jgi:tRNA 2-(methylsulfanyl)-N6-isopentenyladenosine37 hydroxylase
LTEAPITPMKLTVPTSPSWLENALLHFDEVLVDHAHCEKKAAASALSLLQAYPEVPGLALEMAKLAEEEASHLRRVLEFMGTRGLKLGYDHGDPYAQGLQAMVRKGEKERRLDRLLVASLIEGRSCERLVLLAARHPEPQFRAFYAELAESEGGHQRLFVRLAEAVEPPAVVDARFSQMLVDEGALVERLPIRSAMH